MYRDKNLFDLCEELKFFKSEEPIPEALIWFLFTGEIPNEAQVKFLIGNMQQRGKIPDDVEKLVNSLGADVHPMTQLSIGVLALQKYSKFATAYRHGVNKKHYWEHYYEDSLDLMAKLPRLAGLIFNNTYKGKKPTPQNRPEYNMAQNFANMLGLDNKEFHNLAAHYLVLHADHEGGNVSAHGVHLAGSALADAYYSFSAGLNG
jgi:citrate synthase